jgi:hypothetical protein
MEGLDDVKFGDEPRVQQQVVPLSAAAAIPATPPAPAPPPAAPPETKGHRDDFKRELINRATRITSRRNAA